MVLELEHDAHIVFYRIYISKPFPFPDATICNRDTNNYQKLVQDS